MTKMRLLVILTLIVVITECQIVPNDVLPPMDILQTVRESESRRPHYAAAGSFLGSNPLRPVLSPTNSQTQLNSQLASNPVVLQLLRAIVMAKNNSNGNIGGANTNGYSSTSMAQLRPAPTYDLSKLLQTYRQNDFKSANYWG